jgi:hypothetical protein
MLDLKSDVETILLKNHDFTANGGIRMTEQVPELIHTTCPGSS